jgi:hypothetical protein
VCRPLRPLHESQRTVLDQALPRNPPLQVPTRPSYARGPDGVKPRGVHLHTGILVKSISFVSHFIEHQTREEVSGAPQRPITPGPETASMQRRGGGRGEACLDLNAPPRAYMRSQRGSEITILIFAPWIGEGDASPPLPAPPHPPTPVKRMGRRKTVKIAKRLQAIRKHSHCGEASLDLSDPTVARPELGLGCGTAVRDLSVDQRAWCMGNTSSKGPWGRPRGPRTRRTRSWHESSTVGSQTIDLFFRWGGWVRPC